jgi:hypothetical protein
MQATKIIVIETNIKVKEIIEIKNHNRKVKAH